MTFIKFFVLISIGCVTAYKEHVTCERKFQKIGCFEFDKEKPVFPQMLITDRDLQSKLNDGYEVDWQDFGSSTHSLACRCEKKARALGFAYFAIRYYGLCYGGKENSNLLGTLSNHSKISNGCVNGKYEQCLQSHEGDCAGDGLSNYVYKISRPAPKDVDGGYSQWSVWSSCSLTCGEGTQSRERTCTNPKPMGNGKDCTGLGTSTEVKTCKLQNCPGLAVRLISTGCNDTHSKYRYCEQNPTSININGREYTSNGRGFNCLVLSAFTGSVEHKVSFDTFASTKNSNNFAKFLNGLSNYRIVLCVIKDEASRVLNAAAREAIGRLLPSPVVLNRYRAAYAFAGYTGPSKPTWRQQHTHSSDKGPLKVKLFIDYESQESENEVTKILNIRVLSTGCNDPGKYYDKCEKNKNSLNINGREYTKDKRGFNIMVINSLNGKVAYTGNFDTHASKEESNRFAHYLNGLPKYRIIVATVKDEAHAQMNDNLRLALKRILGHKPKLTEYRAAFAFVGYTGPGRPSWIRQKGAKTGKGPLRMRVRIHLYKSAPKELAVRVLSTGCNDPGKYYDKCEKNKNSLNLNGREYTKDKRGFNVMVINSLNGKVVYTGNFDTHASKEESNRFAHYLNGLPKYRIVVATVKDEAHAQVNHNLRLALTRVLGKSPQLTEYRSAFAFIGYTGPGRPYWVRQKGAKSGKGPVRLDVNIPLHKVASNEVEVRTISTGCNDPGKSYDKCHLNKNALILQGVDYTKNMRGFNVMVINIITGRLEYTGAFDTHASKNEANRFADYLNGLQNYRVVVATVKDEANAQINNNLRLAIKRVLGRKPKLTEYLAAFAFVGYTGPGRPYWVRQIVAKNGKGPVRMRAKIPLYRADLVAELHSEGCNDPGPFYDRCEMSPNHIIINKKDVSPNKRGINVAVLDMRNGRLVKREAFDTFASIADSNRLTTLFNKINKHQVIFMVVKDEGALKLGIKTKKAAKRLLGSKIQLKEYRGAFAAAGCGTTPLPIWAGQRATPSGKGPAKFQVAFRYLP